VKKEWISLGVPHAPQLRSEQWPTGMPAAYDDPALARQLCCANALIDFSLSAVSYCISQSRPWFVQNPRNSHLWNYKCWDNWTWADTDFAQCEYGAERPNPIRIRSSTNWLTGLARTCSGNHKHVPWEPRFDNGKFKGFSGASSKGIPRKFADAVAKAIAENCSPANAPLKGLAQTTALAARITSVNCDENKARVARISAASGIQSRGRRVAQLIPEYREELVIRLPASQCMNLSRSQRFDAPRQIGNRTFPKDTKVVSISGGSSSGKPAEEFTIRFGTPWSPVEFFLMARALQHPFEASAAPDIIVRAIFQCVTMGPSHVHKMRSEFFAMWEARAIALREDEAKLIASLHEDIRTLVAKKRPLLLREMLHYYGFPAAELVYQLLISGAPMFGSFPTTGVFPARQHSATLKLEDLVTASKWARPALLGSRRPYADPKMESSLWKKTYEEIARGECRGPFSDKDLDARHPNGWLAAKRFGVPQKGDFRPCDDYSAFGHNATSSSTETVDTEGPDSITGIAKVWTQAMAHEKVHMTLSDGTVLKGKRHPAFSQESARRLLARLIDLEKAYKQLGIPLTERHLAIFALFSSSDEAWSFFEALVLGFGSRNAVFGFNLFARALQFLLAVGLWLAVSHFFDDFTHVDPTGLSPNSCESIERLFNLLGWSYKDSPEDLMPAANSFVALGVIIDLSESGYAIMTNTPKRIERISDEVAKLTALDTIQVPSIQSIVGVCQFMEQQSSGRTGALALRAVRRNMAGGCSGCPNLLKSALRDLGEHVVALRPRKIPLLHPLPPVIVMTDAAYEGNKATLGGLCWDQAAGMFEFFGGSFTEHTISVWQKDIASRSTRSDPVDAQVITHAELAVIPVALALWGSKWRHRNVLFFIDNNAAKDAMIHGVSSSQVMSMIVREVRIECAKLSLGAWYDRVPSPSNLADDPSRGTHTALVQAGAKRIATIGVPHLDIAVFE
jgi:hypothetical protein